VQVQTNLNPLCCWCKALMISSEIPLHQF
jgi:hypothetical protein